MKPASWARWAATPIAGPWSKLGLSIIKNFSLTERQKIRFTADLFDVWNHPVFSSPAFTNVQNPTAFGQIISTENNARIVQFR
jgi:hypothetical protein